MDPACVCARMRAPNTFRFQRETMRLTKRGINISAPTMKSRPDIQLFHNESNADHDFTGKPRRVKSKRNNKFPKQISVFRTFLESIFSPRFALPGSPVRSRARKRIRFEKTVCRVLILLSTLICWYHFLTIEVCFIVFYQMFSDLLHGNLENP
jgi:hypothetical protein